MKIVIISRCILPAIAPRAFRATELAKCFAKKGHDVYLYAVLGHFNYEEFEKETQVKVCSLGKMRFAKQNSDSESSFGNSLLDRVLKRLFGRILEYPDVELAWKTKNVLKQQRDVDLLVTIAIPHPIHWGAAWAKKTHRDTFPKIWVSDCGDPYMGNTVGVKHPRYFQKIEDFWGMMTDYITIPVADGKKAYSVMVQNKILVIPQGFDFTNVKIDVPFKKNSCVKFAFAGAIYPKYRDPSKMLDYLSTLNDVDFQFVVYTKVKDFFEPYRKKLGNKLVLRDYVPRDQLLFDLSQMDFLINIINNSIVQVPSKLIDYYLTQRPIIDISSQFLEKSVLIEFLNGDYTHQHVVGDISQFDINNVAQKFLDLAK